VPLDAEKVITLYGPRRVGKTYYLYQLINSLIPLHGKERIIFINLEDERLLPLDVQDMRLLVEAYYKAIEMIVFRDLVERFSTCDNSPQRTQRKDGLDV
jgi:predicted AAA+ superfamily ATPase